MKVIGDSDFGGRLRGKMARTDLAPVFVRATSEMPAGSPDKVELVGLSERVTLSVFPFRGRLLFLKRA